MPTFEVFIPAQAEAGFDLTFRVTAENWMAALKTGMDKAGVKGRGGNLLVDIKSDESIHVTDPGSGRVFRIQELPEADEAAATPNLGAVHSPVPTGEPPVVGHEQPGGAVPSAPGGSIRRRVEPALPEVEEDEKTLPGVPVPPGLAGPTSAVIPPEPGPDEATPVWPTTLDFEPEPPKEARTQVTRAEPPADEGPEAEADEDLTPVPERPASAPRAPAPPAPTPRAPAPPASRLSAQRRDTDAMAVVQIDTPSGGPVAAAQIGRRVQPSRKETAEEILAELFERAQEIFACRDSREALALTLDLAMAKVPSESGSAYRADISAHTIRVSVARGPKADALLQMDPVIPVGKGLVGVTVEEGVGIAISDADRDPRFFRTISQRLGYDTRSVITVPIQLAGQVMGALQLINRRDGSTFDQHDLSILDYLAHEAAEYLSRSGEVVT